MTNFKPMIINIINKKKLISKIIIWILLLCMLNIFLVNKKIYADDLDHDLKNNFKIDAKSALLIEPSSKKILYEQNSHEKLPPASVTKIMTILLIYEAIENQKIKPDDLVTISEHAANMGGSQIFLEPYEKQTVHDLLKSIVIASANDAAVAMAEYIGGSEENFVNMMNNKAKSLGMNETNFLNACGLDTENHLTSAYDIALMSCELINKYPQVFDLTKIWMDNITHKTHRGEKLFGLTNTNKLIKTYPGATGLKTGSTSKALFCISASAQRDGMNLISVIMGAENPKRRFGEAAKLLDYGFMNYKITKTDPVGTIKGKIKIYKGQKEQANIITKNQISIITPKANKNLIKSKIKLLDYINAPVKKNTKVGEIIYYINQKEVGRSDLIIPENINKSSLINIINKLINKWFSQAS